MNPELEFRLRSLVNFPSPPAVATHIIELARDPDVEMGKVAKALSLDSALSAKILRIANSPLYAQRRRSESLRQSLVVLGLNATLTLALSFSLVKSLRSGKANGISFPFYWRRAFLAATAARALADAMRHPLAEEIFLAALLQDIGILALDQAVPDLYRGGEAVQRDHAALAQLEIKRLQADHAQIGGWLMRTWNLPERLHVAISRSHTLEASVTTDLEVIFARCVAVSGLIADLYLQHPEQRNFAEAAQTTQRCLGLDKMAFGQVLATVGAMIPETQAIFETDQLAEQHPELILEHAREVLMLRNLNARRQIDGTCPLPEVLNTQAFATKEAARRDGITGVFNRAYLDEALGREFEDSLRHNLPLSLAFAELDNFDAINDKFGHPSGDRILQMSARILRDNTRETDLVARYVGERFVVVFPCTDADLARVLCERMVTAFRTTRVTISVGCATHRPLASFRSAADFLSAADQALHVAKMRGRNRSVPFDRHLVLQEGVTG